LKSTVDPDGKYFALLVGSVEKGAEENLLANNLLIWDITNRKLSTDDTSDRGFVMIEKVQDPFYDKDLLRSKIETMGFIKIRGTDTVYLWMLSDLDDITKL